MVWGGKRLRWICQPAESYTTHNHQVCGFVFVFLLFLSFFCLVRLVNQLFFLFFNSIQNQLRLQLRPIVFFASIPCFDNWAISKDSCMSTQLGEVPVSLLHSLSFQSTLLRIQGTRHLVRALVECKGVDLETLLPKKKNRGKHTKKKHTKCVRFMKSSTNSKEKVDDNICRYFFSAWSYQIRARVVENRMS